MLGLRGLPTGIGSLPHKDVDSALDLIFKYTSQIPFWPQLPKKNIRERMVAQVSEGLPCIKLKDEGLIFDDDNKEKELELFYERIINKDIDYFKISEDFASGLWGFYTKLENSSLEEIRFIKCQLCGPFTFAGSVNDKEGKVILHDKVMMQAVLKGLTMKALWQINLFSKFKKPIIIFFDEPYLGCFGSAYTPVNRQEVIEGLTELTHEVKSRGALVGVHCCGNTDWSIFTEVATLDIISFDAFSFLDRLLLYAENLKAFFKKNGVLCWGIVPTSEFTGRETVDLLTDRLITGIDSLSKKGIDKKITLENILLSPSCGMGTLDTKTSEQILTILLEVSKRIRK